MVRFLNFSRVINSEQMKRGLQGAWCAGQRVFIYTHALQIENTEWMHACMNAPSGSLGCIFAHKFFFFFFYVLPLECYQSTSNRVLIIFWIFPTSSFLLLTSLAALSNKFKFLQPILDASPLIQSLLQNVLPIVFVTVFLAFAPLIILGK